VDHPLFSTVCTVTEFSNNLKAGIENLTSSYWIKLIMAIPRKALLLERSLALIFVLW
jgi:hypothetical protein